MGNTQARRLFSKCAALVSHERRDRIAVELEELALRTDLLAKFLIGAVVLKD